MHIIRKHLKKAYKNFKLLEKTDQNIFIITTITATLSILSYFSINILLLALTGIFIHTWIILAKLKKGDFSLEYSNKLAENSFNENINILTIVVSFIGLASSLAIALYKNTTHTGDSSQFLSLAGIILAIVTGYYLWTLDRTEKEGRLTITRLKKRLKDVERTEKTIFMNNELIIELFLIQTEVQAALIVALEKQGCSYLENKKTILKETSEIVNFCRDAYILSQNSDVSGLKVQSLQLLYENSFRNLLSTNSSGKVLIEFQSIIPLLQATANHLNNIKNNEQAKILAKWIEMDLFTLSQTQRSTNARSIT